MAADFAEVFAGAVMQLGFDMEHHLFNCREDGVVLALREEVGPGSDEVNGHAVGGAGLVTAFEANAGFVDLEACLQGEDAFLDESVQRVGGSQVEMFDGEFHFGGVNRG